jgi:uncharacterized protein (DUF2141 family)
MKVPFHFSFIVAPAKVLNFCVAVFVLAVMSGVFGACASTGYPTGGPRDETPPVMIRSTPPADALSFLGDEIRIEFNEIIQVTDIFQKLMVSPPVNEAPVVTARGNTLLVRFQEDLQPNATYTLDFADAVRDNNEANILENFTFSFSTGEYIDSLAISGNLYDATNLAPVANALVMVHSNLADSAFLKQVPIRVTRTNTSGRFSIQNLAPGEYRLFALEDANRNYKYDQPGERIAWQTELVSPYVGMRDRVDSISGDSAVIVQEQAFLPDSLSLFMFKEDNVQQYMADNKRPTRSRLDFVFSRPLLHPLEVNLLNNVEDDWFVYEHSMQHDSVTLWIRDSMVIKGDSLMMQLKYPVLDSLKEVRWETDTLNAYFFEAPEVQSRSRRRDAEETVEVVPALQVDGLKGSLEILEQLALVFPSPLQSLDREAIRMFQMVDTVPESMDFNLVRDSVRIRRYEFDFDRVPGGTYIVEVDSAAFTDIYGLVNAPIKQQVVVKPEDSYGIFYLNINEPQANWLVQVLDGQEEIVRSATVPSNGKIGFRYLKPGRYFARIVEDVNGNGEWDTGNFEQGFQPERMYYYPEEINIRANWDHIVPWDPQEFSIDEFVKRMRLKPKSSNVRP